MSLGGESVVASGSHPELDPIVARLNQNGIRAAVDWVHYKHMEMIGIRTADDFFPLWELTDAVNRTYVAELDLLSIKERRRPRWTPFGFLELDRHA
jgi:hypothetical protein